MAVGPWSIRGPFVVKWSEIQKNCGFANSFPQEFGEQIEEFGLRLREFRGLCHRQGPQGDPRGSWGMVVGVIPSAEAKTKR